MNKISLLKELVNEVAEIVEFREKNKKDFKKFWANYYMCDRKYSKARFRRLRLMIDEILRGIENE